MKKKYLLLIAALSIAIASAFFVLVSCTKEPEKLTLINEKISYIERRFLRYECDDFMATLISGEKEKRFVADGKCTDVAPYLCLSVDPVSVDIIGKVYNYSIEGENGNLTGELKKSLLGVNYSAEIRDGVDIGNIKAVSVTIGDTKYDLEFADMLDSKIDADKAIEYAYNELEASLEKSFENGEFIREVYVKYINDPRDGKSPYYWYVSFFKDASDYLSVLIDPVTGTVIK